MNRTERSLHMEIRVLRYFLTVVREESITKASEVLHITQPTLSRQLAQMEEEIGVKLWKRGRSAKWHGDRWCDGLQKIILQMQRKSKLSVIMDTPTKSRIPHQIIMLEVGTKASDFILPAIPSPWRLDPDWVQSEARTVRK